MMKHTGNNELSLPCLNNYGVHLLCNGYHKDAMAIFKSVLEGLNSGLSSDYDGIGNNDHSNSSIVCNAGNVKELQNDGHGIGGIIVAIDSQLQIVNDQILFYQPEEMLFDTRTMEGSQWKAFVFNNVCDMPLKVAMVIYNIGLNFLLLSKDGENSLEKVKALERKAFDMFVLSDEILDCTRTDHSLSVSDHDTNEGSEQMNSVVDDIPSAMKWYHCANIIVLQTIVSLYRSNQCICTSGTDLWQVETRLVLIMTLFCVNRELLNRNNKKCTNPANAA